MRGGGKECEGSKRKAGAANIVTEDNDDRVKAAVLPRAVRQRGA